MIGGFIGCKSIWMSAEYELMLEKNWTLSKDTFDEKMKKTVLCLNSSPHKELKNNLPNIFRVRIGKMQVSLITC